MKNNILCFFVFCLFIAFIFVVNGCQHKVNEGRIQSWAVENDYVVDSIEKQYWSNGPFWYRGKGYSIYRAEVHDKLECKKVAWFRMGLWSYKQEWGE